MEKKYIRISKFKAYLVLTILILVAFHSNTLLANQMELTSCKTPRGGKQNICFYQDPDEGKVFCLGSSFGECPTSDVCKKEFKSKLGNKEWQAWSISGRNKTSPSGGASIPATKKCKFVAEQTDRQFNNIHKYISVKCGDSPMYLATKLQKQDGSYNSLKMTEPLIIDGKSIKIEGDIHMVWSALMKQSLDNEMTDQSIKVQKIKGERDILEKIKSSGVDLSKINPQSDIEFSYQFGKLSYVQIKIIRVTKVFLMNFL